LTRPTPSRPQIDGPVAFMSDLHLDGSPRDERIIACLNSLQGRIEHLFLVGDIFDFNLGYQDTLYRRFFRFYRALADLVDRGVQLSVFTGNHDPDPCPLLTQELGGALYTAPTEFLIQGRVVLVEHGDQADPHPLKRRVCAAVRSPSLRWLARRLSPSIAHHIATLYKGHNRSVTPPLPLQIHKRWLELIKGDLDLWIMGHYHRAMALPSPDPHPHSTSPSLVVLGDWIRLNTFLLWEDSPQLMRWSSPDILPLPLGDHTDHLCGT
jgi:UDP-2,3-diacylglucosamine hydrolase